MIRYAFLALLLFPAAAMGQQITNKTWEDVALKSYYDIRYDTAKKRYTFQGEKYQRKGEFGTLAKGSADRIRQVVAYMDSAFQSKDADRLFALGRFKYTYHKVSINNGTIDVEMLKVEDLIKDDSGKLPIYMMSQGTLSGIVAFVRELE